MEPRRSWSPLLLAGLAGAWVLLCVWCAFVGFPPAVDLAAHGAQIETLKNLLRGGDPELARAYQAHFVSGYGLVFWLFLPVAWLTSGAVAARVAWLVALLLFPLSLRALLRAWGRDGWLALLGLPLAFNLSYWYGLLPNQFAIPLLFLSLAALERALERRTVGRLVALNLLAAATFQTHLLSFVALALFAMVRVLVLARPLRDGVVSAALGFGLPLLLAVPKGWEMATRAVMPGDWPPTEYNAAAHLNWFFRNYRPEGWLAAVGPLAVTAALVLLWWRRRTLEPRAPVVLFLAAVVLYLVTPKTLSGIYLIHARLPVLAGGLALGLVDGSALGPRWRAVLAALTLFSLGETVVFHARFHRAVEGLETVIVEAPAGRTAYWPSEGTRLLGSRHIYAEHLGQWFTASRGGVGSHFFADAQHHPVHYTADSPVPRELARATPEQLRYFDQVLVFGDGPLLPALEGWRPALHAGHWTLLRRP